MSKSKSAAALKPIEASEPFTPIEAPKAPEPTHRWFRLERINAFEWRVLHVDLTSEQEQNAVQDGKSDVPRNLYERLDDEMYSRAKKEFDERKRRDGK